MAKVSKQESDAHATLLAARQRVVQVTADAEKERLAAEADVLAAERAVTVANARQLSEEKAAALPDLAMAVSKAVQRVRDINSEKTPPGATGAAQYDARLRLAQEAQARAERDYREALEAIHSDHLATLVESSK